MNIEQAMEYLSRFPQCAELTIIGDRGIEDLRVFAPDDGRSTCENWSYYCLDAPDTAMPWCGAVIDGAVLRPKDIGGVGHILCALTDDEWDRIRAAREAGGGDG